MIKAFLFDWGGVMSNGGRGGELAERLAANIGISPETAQSLLQPLWDRFATGALTENELWKKVEQRHGGPIAAIKRKIWNTWAHTGVIPEMKQLVERLRREGYPAGLVSNVIPPTAEQIRAHGGYALFDFHILSCEVGVAKPDPKIYQLAMEKLPGIRTDEVIFIDDQQRCLEPAKAMGMQTILAKNPAQINADVAALIKV